MRRSGDLRHIPILGLKLFILDFCLIITQSVIEGRLYSCELADIFIGIEAIHNLQRRFVDTINILCSFKAIGM